MPGIAPRTATPTKQTMDSQNSQRWMRKIRTQVGDLDQADGRGDHDRGQCGGGQMLEQVRRHHQQQGNGERADDSGQLRSGARGLGHGRARRTAADRKALKESGGQIGGAEPHHLLVGVDIRAGPRRIGAREHAGVGERHQGDGAAADQDRDDIGVGDPRDRERRQALGERTEDRHVGARCQVQHANDCRRADHGDQDARHALAVLEQQDHRQCAGADRERRPVRSSAHDRLRRWPIGSRSGPSLSIEKPKSLGNWLISTVSAMPFM